MKVDKRFLFGGHSVKCGVTFDGSKYTVASYRNSRNELKTIVKEIDDYSKPFDNSNREGKKAILKLILFVALIIIIDALISFSFQYCARGTFVYYFYYILIQVLMLAVLVKSLYMFVKNDYDEVTKYHGAEHKVANAFEKYGYVPSIDEVRKCSRYHPRCGVSIPTNHFFAINVFFALTCIFKIYMPPLFILLLVASFICSFNPYSYFLQMFLTTKNPDDDHLEVAMKAYERLLELEKGISEIHEDEYDVDKKFELIDRILDFDYFSSADEEFFTSDEASEYIKAHVNEFCEQAKYEDILFMIKKDLT